MVSAPDGSFKSVSAKGHAGFGFKGKDIVCAAETCLLRTAMKVLNETEGIVLEVHSGNRGELSFSVSGNGDRERLKCIADFIRQGIKDLSLEYPKLVEFRELT